MAAPKVPSQHGKRGATTFFVNFPLTFLSGILFSLLAFERTEGPYIPFFRRRPFVQGIFFCLGLYGISLFAYALEPDWVYMYFVREPYTDWIGLVYIGLILYLTPFALGFGLGVELRKNSFITVAFFIVLAILVQIAILVWLWDRYWWVGSLQQYLQGKAKPLLERSDLFWGSLAGGAILLSYFAGLALYYRREKQLYLITSGALPSALYPNQIRIIQALGEHMFAPIYSKELLGKEQLGQKFSRYISSMPWLNRVGLSLIIEIFQILPILLLFRPRFFTSLTTEEKDAFLERLEKSSHILLLQIFLVLKTILCFLYYDEEQIMQQFVLKAHPKDTSPTPSLPPSTNPKEKK